MASCLCNSQNAKSRFRSFHFLTFLWYTQFRLFVSCEGGRSLEWRQFRSEFRIFLLPAIVHVNTAYCSHAKKPMESSTTEARKLRKNLSDGEKKRGLPIFRITISLIVPNTLSCLIIFHLINQLGFQGQVFCSAME